jgi:hypothetical protein
MVDWLNYIPSWHDALAKAVPFAESNFITALVGSLSGAFGGAWAAQRIAERTNLRQELVKEIRNTNAASSMLYGIANAHLGLKSQHIKSLHDKFREEETNLDLFLKAKEAGTVPPQQVFQFNADLQTLKPQLSPTEQIQRLMFDEISITGAVLVVLPILMATMQSLNETLLDRNRLVEEWKANQPRDFPRVYFGLEQDGIIDQRYRMLVEAIYNHTDDVIAFSTMIGDALYTHAIAQRQKLRGRFRIDGQAITKIDFSRFKDFIPPAKEYENFAAMFEATQAAPAPKLWLHQRLWTGIVNRGQPAKSGAKSQITKSVE